MNQKRESVADLEALMRAGEMATVSRLIQTLNRNQIPRSELVQYANIANRVDLGRIAHRFLQPIVRSEQPNLVATDPEKIEYAEALRGMGLIAEALKVLKEVDAKLEPTASLRLSFCLMTLWQYQEAIPHLRQYIAAVDPKSYTSQTAKVNLAAALVVERQDQEALELLHKLRAEAQAANHQLLYGNCLELLAQLYVLKGSCDLADAALDEADSSFANARTRYSLYLRKWRAISKSIRSNSVHPELFECREDAIQDRDWETHRECDLYIGFLNQDHELLRQVYFGTPFQSYRKRILNLTGNQFLAGNSYVWNQWTGEEVRSTFDLLKGSFDASSEALESGQLMHRLFMVLCSDFYRPVTVGTAFSELFSGEHFSQSGSTNRVFQVVKRLRLWLEENGSLLTIDETGGSYRLKAQYGVGIRVPDQRPELSPQAVTWLQLKSKLKVERFSRNDVIEVLNCSQASANRLLRWSIETGQSEAIGAGPGRKYRFAA